MKLVKGDTPKYVGIKKCLTAIKIFYNLLIIQYSPFKGAKLFFETLTNENSILF